MENKTNYFAYGSNLNINRMIDRGLKVHKITPVILENYELKFNKVSKKQGAVANIEPKHGSVVEGVLYEIDDITKMDRYEGHPNHYKRVEMMFGTVKAWVYIAQPKYIKEGLKPKQEYLNHLLAGKEYLSEEYYKTLERLNS